MATQTSTANANTALDIIWFISSPFLLYGIILIRYTIKDPFRISPQGLLVARRHVFLAANTAGEPWIILIQTLVHWNRQVHLGREVKRS